LGDDFGFSFSQRILNHTTIEANVSDGLFSQNKYLTLAAKQHHNVLTRRFNVFIGAGYFGQSSIAEVKEDPDFLFRNHGVMAVFGGEFTLGRINISVDYSPRYTFSNGYNSNHLSADSALSIKYVLWKRKSGIKKFFEKIF
jgi:hypothetical protein